MQLQCRPHIEWSISYSLKQLSDIEPQSLWGRYFANLNFQLNLPNLVEPKSYQPKSHQPTQDYLVFGVGGCRGGVSSLEFPTKSRCRAHFDCYVAGALDKMVTCTLLQLWKLLLISGILLQETTHGNRRMHGSGGLTSVLVLDIDGTVYDDDCLIESQIRDNCHIFSGTFGYSVADSENMHLKFGSTIRGICEYGQPRIKFLDYYNDVYPHLDMSLLRKYSGIKASGNTGYNVEMGDALQSLHHLNCPIVVASNSPVFHVKRVLARLGLTKLKVDAFITPERRNGLTKNEAEFWDPLFELFPPKEHLCTLIDDNGLNVELVRKLGKQQKIKYARKDILRQTSFINPSYDC